MSDTIRLYDVEQGAIADLRYRLNDLIEENEIVNSDQIDDEYHNDLCDIISEVTDSSVPIYTSDLLRLAADNLSLAVDEPELGPAFDGSPTPVNIIAANVYEHIGDRLWEYVRDELEYDSAIKYSPTKYIIEPEFPSDPPEWSTWNKTTDDNANPYTDIPASFWEAFNACINNAIGEGYSSIVIEWNVTERDVTLWNDFRAQKLIDQQHDRNTGEHNA